MANQQSMLFLGAKGLVSQYPKWMDKRIGVLVRSFYVLPRDWQNLFVKGHEDFNLFTAYVKDGDRQWLAEMWPYVITQADKAGRVMYYLDEIYGNWKDVLNIMLLSKGFKSLPPESFSHGLDQDMARYNPGIILFS